MSEKSRDILIVAVVMVLSIMAYASTLTHELVWDDIGIVRYIDSTVEEGGLPALLSAQFATHIEEGYVSGYYRPVVVASLWFDSLIKKFFPRIYHLTNILLHALNTLLVFILLRFMTAPYGAAVGAMIFAVHPVHSESVAFVSGRTDLWAAFFLLLAVIAWIRERKGLSPAPARERFWSFAAFFMACLSKEAAILLPAVLLVWEAVVPGSEPAGKAAWWSRNRKWVLGWALVLTSVLVLRFLVFGVDLGLDQSRTGSLSSAESTLSLLMIGRMLLVYLRLLVLPWPLRIYYGPAELQVTWLVVLGAILFLLMVLYTYRRCARSDAIQSVVWIFLFLVPVLAVGARGGALLAERFLYIPSVGFCLMAGALAAVIKIDRRLVNAGMGLLIAIMLVGSMKQSAVWKNEITLFSEHIKVAPTVINGHYNLGNAYSAKGRQLDAVREYRGVVASDRDHYKAWFNMGNSLAALKRYEEAAEAFQQALRIKPELIAGYVNLGATLLKAGEFEKSASVYRKGLDLAPGDTKLNLGLILVYLETGNRQAAEDHIGKLEEEDKTLAGIINKFLLESQVEGPQH